MTDQDIRTVLARMAGAPASPASEEAALTPARAVRMAFARATESSCGLKVGVTSLDEEEASLDAVAAALQEGDLVLDLRSPDGTILGMAALDRELRAAFVESQTMGRLSAVPAPDRPVSVADRALCAPVVDAVLTDLAVAAGSTALAGWADGARTGGRIDGGRGVSLQLPEDRYRLLRLEVDLSVAGRAGRMLLALPAERGRPAADPASSDWTERLHRLILSAPAVLTAVLHRMSLPISRLEDIAPGDLLPLDGVTVSSVRLEGAGNTLVATARLGQVGGMKAVRLEPPPPPELREATHPPASVPPALPQASVRPRPPDASVQPGIAPAPASGGHAAGASAPGTPDAVDMPQETPARPSPADPAGPSPDPPPWEEEQVDRSPSDRIAPDYPPDPRQT
ncbi:FliM/FliN family flagellar motor switch protein [Histidinibacterium lentulum]|uniref:Flagellar motor switch protein FliN-like C-terminal domain-containing protein n=1 Tax=Histidinibacterium lentulum TaxID=2480588 RepID=A0A3N2QTS4_9RHOB|nr:flagellar motor switch protein FliM [Histidinibacterium lentulum]ROT98614.1 hypothetical protein EAT49_16895 [Histidinibacterium lentulum]